MTHGHGWREMSLHHQLPTQHETLEEHVIYLNLGSVHVKRPSNFFLTAQLKFQGVVIDPIVKPRTDVTSSTTDIFEFKQSKFVFKGSFKWGDIHKQSVGSTPEGGHEDDSQNLHIIFKLFEMKSLNLRVQKSSISMISKGKSSIPIASILMSAQNGEDVFEDVCTLVELPPEAALQKISFLNLKDAFGTLKFTVSIKKNLDHNLRRKSASLETIILMEDVKPSYLWSLSQDDPYLKDRNRYIEEDFLTKYFINFHAVLNLPMPTRVYITLKTTKDVLKHLPARSITVTSPESKNFVWHDALSVSKKEKEKAGLFVSLIDYHKKTYIAKCIIPTETLIPGEQYNLALILNEQGTCILASLHLEDPPSFRMEIYKRHPEMVRLEVQLQGIQLIQSKGKTESFGTLIAVVHIVDNLSEYLKKIEESRPRIPFQEVHLDDAKAFQNLVPSSFRVSKPSRNTSLYPQFNFAFKMDQNFDSFYNQSGALIIEIFQIDYPKDLSGNIECLAWSTIPLHDLSKCGSRDGQSVKYSPQLHFFSSLKGSNRAQDPCYYGLDCAHHRYSINLEIRKWTSRNYVKHLNNKQHMAYSSDDDYNMHDSLSPHTQRKKSVRGPMHVQIPHLSLGSNIGSKSEPSSPNRAPSLRNFKKKSYSDLLYTRSQSEIPVEYPDPQIALESPLSFQQDLISEDSDDSLMYRNQDFELNFVHHGSDSEASDIEDDYQKKLKMLQLKLNPSYNNPLLYNLNSPSGTRRSSTESRLYLPSIVEEQGERRRSVISIDSQDLNDADWDSSDDELVDLYKRRMSRTTTPSPPTSDKIYSPTFGRRQADADLKPPFGSRRLLLRSPLGSPGELNFTSGTRSPINNQDYLMPECVEDILERTENLLTSFDTHRMAYIEKIRKFVHSIKDSQNLKDIHERIAELDLWAEQERIQSPTILNQHKQSLELLMNRLANEIKTLFTATSLKSEPEIRKLRQENTVILSENEVLRNKMLQNGADFSEELLSLKRKIKEKSKKISLLKRRLGKKGKKDVDDEAPDSTDEDDDTTGEDIEVKKKKDEDHSNKKSRKKRELNPKKHRDELES